MEDDHKWKITSNGRRSQMEEKLYWKTTSTGRQESGVAFEEVSETQNVGRGRIQYFLMSVFSSY